MIYLPWLLEFVLECSGAILNRRSRLLSTLLAFCALSDAVLLVLYQNARQSLYAWAYWGQRSLKYLLLCWLACSICGMFVSPNRRHVTVVSAAFLSLCTAAFSIVGAVQGTTLKDRLLDGEIAANMVLLACVAVGWIGRHKVLDSRWKWITAGFILMVGSDLLFTGMWTFWDGARHWYPVGAIAAQLVWVVGPLRSVRLPEFRQSLEKKFPAVEEMRVM